MVESIVVDNFVDNHIVSVDKYTWQDSPVNKSVDKFRIPFLFIHRP